MRLAFLWIILVGLLSNERASSFEPWFSSGFDSSRNSNRFRALNLDGLQQIGAINVEPFWISEGPAPSVKQRGKLVQLELDSASTNIYREVGSGTEEVDLSAHLLDGFRSRLTLPKVRQSEHLRYTSYRSTENTISLIPEKGDRFGMTTIESAPFQESGYVGGLTAGYGFHFLSGPTRIDLPSRLYTFALGYQHRGRFTEFSSYDFALNCTVNSDFEGSAREGVLFPGHAVGMLHITPETDLVLGVDHLHRDDIKLLPVFGFSRHSSLLPNVRYDCVFPRPKVQFSLPSGRVFHIAGRLGGGTWDMELPSGIEDVVTYRDYRLLLGLSRRETKRANHFFEVGYLFARKIELRDNQDSMNPKDAVILQFVTLK